jgi:adenylosuccinate synthase
LKKSSSSYRSFQARIGPFIIDTSEYLFRAVRQGKKLLFEGAPGNFPGRGPRNVSFRHLFSNTIAGSACTGAGVGPTLIDHVIGIVKAYTTRVGNGPFPTEQDNETGEALRSFGGEFGATTGRPRRCGWFDSVLLRKAVQLNGITRLALDQAGRAQ